jgi:hypothetical protein
MVHGKHFPFSGEATAFFPSRFSSSLEGFAALYPTNKS